MGKIVEQFDYVVGVDTHARTHTYTLVAAATGVVAGTETFPTSAAGIGRAIAWLRRRSSGSGRPVFAAVEGTSSYGAKLTEALQHEQIPVGEIRPPAKSSRAHGGKSDPIDAEAAARFALARDDGQIAQPRTGGKRQALRVLLAARHLIDGQRTANRNALTALLRVIDLGVDVRRPITARQLEEIRGWRARASDDTATTIARQEARRLAAAIQGADQELNENRTSLLELAEELAPGLQTTAGVGPVTAAIIVCAYSHPGRVRNEAAFAALGGVAPLPASSGNTTRHRLSRSGDRQLNRAFDVIARTRMSCDPTTRAYVERARATGKSSREIRRNLKRYISPQIFRQLHALAT
jgi:transposase